MEKTPLDFFGAIVKITSTEATNDLLLAGMEGKIQGFSTPDCSRLTSKDIVVGEIDPNFPIYAVYFPKLDKVYWFSPQLLELINATPPLKMKIGDRQIKRDESGTWFEMNEKGEWIEIEEP